MTSSVRKKYWYSWYGLVRRASSHTVPDSVLPNFVPSALSTRGVVRPYTSSRRALRMSSIPMVMLPHWSLAPSCSRQPSSSNRRRKS